MEYHPWSSKWLDAVCQLWNEQCGDRFPMRPELLRQNSLDDPHLLPEGSWVAVEKENQRLVGVVIAKKWSEADPVTWGKGSGWIQALLVDRACRRQGIGAELLKRAESALFQQNVEKISLGSDWWHYFPGVPDEEQETMRWAEKRGYIAGKQLFDLISSPEETAGNRSASGVGQPATGKEQLAFSVGQPATGKEQLAFSVGQPATGKERPASGVEQSVSGKERPAFGTELPTFAEVTFREGKPEDRDALMAFFNRCFPGRWEYEALCYFEKGGTGREFVLAEKNGAIIGFCRINDARSPIIAQNVYWAPLFADELGGIGPLGIDPQERKYGYGRGVVEAGIYFLRQRGIERICIDWTDLVDFYRKLGFEVWKGYRSYSKILNVG
ncbi:GNAT family N-acetyltransferase [Brevibacillus borstelensis]|uniref:GNAT family N-acetyltransferase n=1 Tax=Brevibacillus borstelensis TaxID=45462 RepID=UPI0030CC8B4D